MSTLKNKVIKNKKPGVGPPTKPPCNDYAIAKIAQALIYPILAPAKLGNLWATAKQGHLKGTPISRGK